MGENIMKWKYFCASIKGTSHQKTDSLKQDSCSVNNIEINNENYLVIAVADGAGSAKKSDVSSKYICSLFTKKTHRWLKDNKLNTFTREIVSEWFNDFQKVLNRLVKLYKLDSIRDFATTFLFAILSEDCNVFVQIGDGIIAVDFGNGLDCVFQPQNGEFLNTTRFATEQDAIDIFMYEVVNEPILKIAMHTDGIEQIGFDFAKQKPFNPFFTPFFNALENSETIGAQENLSKQLANFLNSDRVNSKTDDDKTLVIACSYGFIKNNKKVDSINEQL